MGEIAPEEQFLPLSTIFCYLMLDFCVNTGIRFSLRDKRLFEITEVEIARVDCIIEILFYSILETLKQLCHHLCRLHSVYGGPHSWLYGWGHSFDGRCDR